METRSQKQISDSKKRLEILYEGYYYDVTSFASKHPGGNVIRYYTEKGEDASQAIQQFHNRFMPKVNLMLKGFKKRPATTDDGIKIGIIRVLFTTLPRESCSSFSAGKAQASSSPYR